MRGKYYRYAAGVLGGMCLLVMACGGGDMKAATGEGASVEEMSTAAQGETAAENTPVAAQEAPLGVETEDVETQGESQDMEGERYQAEWTKDAVIYEVNVRQYTEEGTFRAFSEHLQEVKDMGVNTLWFMPVHPISETKRSGTLGSYYSITDYREINPEFGTKEDFAALVDRAHEMGFHVMMDWVANHTGWDCPWIKEHPDWYTRDAAGNIISPEGMGWPDVADLNYENADMRAEMISCMKYWVEEYDIDGFRCDYANGVPTDFWEEARTELEEVKPLYMLAEDDKALSLLNRAFDFNYNLHLYDTLLSIAKDSKNADSVKYYIPENYPDGTYTMNFLDNHDKNSYENNILSGFGTDALPAMFSLIYTIPGTPMIYTGDEIGLDHNIAFMEKDTVNWNGSELSYRGLLAELGKIRSSNPALYSGNYGGAINYYDLDNKHVLAFYRGKDGNLVKCLFNLSKREQTIDVTELFDGTETVLLYGQGGEELRMEDHAVTEERLEGEITMKPWEFWIVMKEE